MNRRFLYWLGIVLLFMAGESYAQRVMDLSGKWKVTVEGDTYDIVLPTTLDMAGIGTPTALAPSLDKQVLQHLTRRVSYVGEAAYTREVTITPEMAHKPLAFHFERVLWRSRLYIDGVEVGSSCESLATPHSYHLAEGLSEGVHTLLLKVDNSKQYDISFNDFAHAYTNETQTMWNGVLGTMTMTVHEPLHIASLQTYPDVEAGAVKVKVTIVRHPGAPRKAHLKLSAVTPDDAMLPATSHRVKLQSDTTVVELHYPITAPRLWSEASPVLYTLHATVEGGDVTTSSLTRFGMRELASDKGYLELNGNRIFLRGTLECCIFPLTGCPPTDDEGWRQVYGKAREWGLNHLRFHSYCPPEAAFRVADEMGFYLQAELPVWSTKIGTTPEAEAFLQRELDRILEAYGNHPSFCLMTSGNEMQADFDYLNGLMRHARQTDPRRLYAATSFTFEKGHGSVPEPEDEFFVTQWTDNGWVRGQGVFDEQPPRFDANYTHAMPTDKHAPLISHEIGQYSVYPNLKEIAKYTGTLMPLNFIGIRNDLKQKGLLHKAEDYTQASGRLAALLYKEEIERALRTPDFNGYQLLGLQDFPGQSTALVGLVDAFWDSKGVCDPADFRQFCAPVVPLALFPKATYDTDESFEAYIEVANYSGAPIVGDDIRWSITDERGDTLHMGVLRCGDIGQGRLTRVGHVAVPLHSIEEATRLTLSINIGHTTYRNSWHFWVYDTAKADKSITATADIVVTADVDIAVKAAREGHKVLLSPRMTDVVGIEGKFVPVFWSPVHFPKQAGTMGLLLDEEHQAFAHFPTEGHSDWQWWSIVKRSRVMDMDVVPGATPLLESVDNFANNRRLASIFEAKLHKGSIIVCSIDLLTDDTLDGAYKTGITPEIKQLEYSLLRYMQSPGFAPQGTVSEEQLHQLIQSGGHTVKATTGFSVYE